jgi:hypothetical protein
VHETGRSKPLLTQIRPDGLDLQIIEHASPARSHEEEILFFAVGLRIVPGSGVSPAVDLQSSHNFLSTVGSWWTRAVFAFQSRVGPHMTYSRSQILLSLVNREGGAHVDPNEDVNYVRLLTDLPLTLSFGGVQIAPPDLAQFLAAQSGVEMLECLKRNFFPASDVPSNWECGSPPPVAMYLDQISAKAARIIAPSPMAEIRVTKRG